jgi:hypothetical protein
MIIKEMFGVLGLMVNNKNQIQLTQQQRVNTEKIGLLQGQVYPRVILSVLQMVQLIYLCREMEI